MINTKLMEKYDIAYANLPVIQPAVEFDPSSEYYYTKYWMDVLERYIPGVIPNMYIVSNCGDIMIKPGVLKQYPNGKLRNHSINGKGYHQVSLARVDGGQACVKVHRLVMLHFRFIPNCQYYEVDHLDGNKDNNTIWNLEWVTPQENTYRAITNNQRTASYTSDTNIILSDKDARELYAKAIKGENYVKLSMEYNVDIDYIKGLVRGSIRPYISGRTNYSSVHYDETILKPRNIPQVSEVRILTDKDKEELYCRVLKGENYVKLAMEYKVSIQFINDLMSKK